MASPVLVVLGDADDLEVKDDDNVDGEDEPEAVISDRRTEMMSGRSLVSEESTKITCACSRS